MNPSVPKRHFEGRTFACHAAPVGSVTFTEVQEVLFCKAFDACAFIADRVSSKYLLTETLTFRNGQLITSTADSHSDEHLYCRCGVRVPTRLRSCAVR
jgi:hypothetical protein